MLRQLVWQKSGKYIFKNLKKTAAKHKPSSPTTLMRVTAFNRYTGRQRDEACVGLDGQSPAQLRCRVPPSLASLPIAIRLRPAAVSLTMLDVVRQFIPVWQCDRRRPTYERTVGQSRLHSARAMASCSNNTYEVIAAISQNTARII